MNELINNAELFFRNECEQRNIIWQSELSDPSLMLEFDIIQMEQALYNIIKNAIESIDYNGTICIITENSHQKKLIIRDSGKGISKEISDQLFTPFFSTKINGQGVGLTLTKEVLLNHNFKFNLETKSEACTEFTIIFTWS